jgi:hypothetical protein
MKEDSVVTSTHRRNKPPRGEVEQTTDGLVVCEPNIHGDLVFWRFTATETGSKMEKISAYEGGLGGDEYIQD